jgi:predicted AAA+ superfamily ATPase
VQDIPEAIEALKYFYEQAPEYHITVAGSLLGISLHQGVSFPVGKVDELNVFPMNFMEFLDAIGEQQSLALLENRDFDGIAPLHEKFVDLLRQYYYVGGMPEAVKLYAESKALRGVREIQKSILRGYEQDFSKHAPKDQVAKIKLVWKSVPSQLFKENKKFIYGALRKGARATQYEEAIEWLIDSGLLYKVSRVSKPALPLSIYEELNIFKLYALDVGLLGAMANTDSSQILIKSDLIAEFNGGLAEQFILQQMKSKQIDPIYYHSTDDSRLELDFLIQSDGHLLPIEVKSGESVRSNSLSMLLQKTPGLRAIRYSLRPYKEQNFLTNIPLYAV